MESNFLSILDTTHDEMIIICKALNICWSLNRKIKKHKRINDFSNNFEAEKTLSEMICLASGLYKSLESMNSDIMFCKKKNKSELKNLKKVINFRRAFLPTGEYLISDNSVNIQIDRARISYLEKRYDEALKELLLVANTFIHKNRLPTMSLYRVYQFLGNIYATIGKFENAVVELKYCIEIGKELQLQDDYSVNVQLGRFLNEFCEKSIDNSEEYNKSIEASEEHNNAVKSVVEQLDVNSRKSFLGDTLYNLATLQKLKGNLDAALEIYMQALDEYQNCNAHYQFFSIGKARCYRKMFEIHKELGSIDKAKADFKMAKKHYKHCFDKNHPEVVEFLKSKSKKDI